MVPVRPRSAPIRSTVAASPKTAKGPRSARALQETGGDLLSQGVTPQVPSAQTGLTSVFGMGTGVSPSLSPPRIWLSTNTRPRRPTSVPRAFHSEHEHRSNPSPRPISTGLLNTLLCVHIRPINVVVYHGPYLVDPVRSLILELVSRLDAFSAYPFRRSLTSRALGRTTGTRELRPSRSSRTRDSLPQASSGCSG